MTRDAQELTPGPERITPYYEDEWATIYHGDAFKILPTLPPVDLVLTDPPYSDETHDNARTNTSRNRQGVRLVKFDSFTEDDIRRLFTLLQPLTARWFVATMEWRHIVSLEETPPEGWRFLRFGIWAKKDGMPQISGDRPAQGWEGLAFMHREGSRPRWNGGGRSSVFIHGVARGNHPTEKPLGLVRQWVELFSDPGGLVLDPFMGSGTTLCAAKNAGRRSIGIELKEEWCRTAAARLRGARRDLVAEQGELGA